MNCDPYTKHKLGPRHKCSLTCDCKKRDSFSSGTLGTSLGQCNGGIPSINVESYSGGSPGTTGSMFVSSAQLELCDSLQFYTEGTTELNVQEGSAQVGIEAANILSGSGEPMFTPLAPNRNFIYHDTMNNVLYSWSGSWNQVSLGGSSGIMMLPDFWRTKTGQLPDGTSDVVQEIVHESDICIGVSGSIRVGGGISGSDNILLAKNVDIPGDKNVILGTNTFPSPVVVSGEGNVSIGHDTMVTSDNNDNNISIGNKAGQNRIGSFGISLGFQSGQTDQRSNAISIGQNSGQNDQFENAISIGQNSGQFNQDANCISIGIDAGKNNQRLSSIAIGEEAGTTGQGPSSIAIGKQAGLSRQVQNCIAIGEESGEFNQQLNSIAIGHSSGRDFQNQNSIAIGTNSGENQQKQNCVSIGNEAGQHFQELNAIAIGNGAGKGSSNSDKQRRNSIAIGTNAGQTNQGLGDFNEEICAIAIGENAGQQNQRVGAIAIGQNAGQVIMGNNSIAIGRDSQSGNIGNPNTIAIGFEARSPNNGSIVLGNDVTSDQGGQFVVKPGSEFKTIFNVVNNDTALPGNVWWHITINGSDYSIPMYNGHLS